MIVRIALNSIAFLVVVLISSCLHGQEPSDAHSGHHPGQEQTESTQSDQGNGSKDEPDSGGMGGGMGGMMEKMGAPKPREMYPKLMDFPNLTQQQRDEFRQEAHDRMVSGAALMSDGLVELSNAAATDDFDTMQSATSKMREGLAQFESGLAAHRAIAEGKPPQDVAMQWFKKEMNLLPPTAQSSNAFSLFGMSLFHSMIMLTLVAFTAVMIWMYFHKMRRAAALLEKLVSETNENEVSSSAIQTEDPVAPQAVSAAKNQVTLDTKESGCCEDSSAECEETCATGPGESGSGESDLGTVSSGLLPVAKRKLCKLRVAKIYDETSDVKTFRLVSCHGGPIPFSYLPGQFLTLTLPVAEKPIRRSYTIASAPTQGYYCEITVKREDKGAGSRFLHDSIKQGDLLEVQAPNGKFVFTGKESEDVVLVAGGVGITPMMSIARAMTDMGWRGEIYFIVACRDVEHFIFESELQRLQQRHANLHVFAAMSQVEVATDQYRVGRLNREMLSEWVPDIASKRVHICGPVPMMEAMKNLFVEMGVEAGNVHTENFGSQAKPKAKSKAKSRTSLKPETATPDKNTSKPGAKTATNVEFKSSGKSTLIEPDETLLEAAERIDVDIDNSCRVGMCGVCAVKILSGEVSMDVDDGLDPDDRAAGKVLACQAKCSANIVVDA